MDSIIRFKNYSVYAKKKVILDNINLEIYENNVNTVLGPSGSGKSTLLRSINRLIELTPGLSYSGEIYFKDKNIFDYQPEELRRQIGMVFQQPNPFNFSIFENVAFGPRLHWKLSNAELEKIVKDSLIEAALYDEVKDDLKKSALRLSGGQQQRLCIARALAVKPSVLMMDEPTSSLDPVARTKIEDLIVKLKEKYTVVLITHDVRQAARISDFIAFIYNGKILEHGSAESILENPKNRITEEFLTDRLR
ncbi:MAG: phosphate ABC transporter ATP-binding protein [Thermoplasmata archaeon]|jgi:phosphate transport system ATP-binding protein|nr:phosphate ABC transporter ATP-binding protein [Thermoplasmatales archaeon]